MTKGITLNLALMAMIVSALPAQSGQCGYEDCWGAIGFDNQGKIGVAYSHWSEERAYRFAQNDCGWNCAEMRTFKNACAAIARGENGSWSWAKGSSRSSAEQSAHQLCETRTHNCKTVVWACSR